MSYELKENDVLRDGVKIATVVNGEIVMEEGYEQYRMAAGNFIRQDSKIARLRWGERARWRDDARRSGKTGNCGGAGEDYNGAAAGHGNATAYCGALSGVFSVLGRQDSGSQRLDTGS